MSKFKTFLLFFLLVFVFQINSLKNSEAESIKVQQQTLIKPETVITQNFSPIQEFKVVTPTPKPLIKQQASYKAPIGEIQSYARSKVSNDTQWNCLVQIWGKESGWQPGRLNKSSLAVGIPQALPPTKIYPEFYSMERITINGKLFLAKPDYKREINWGISYINKRYSSPCGAYSFWQVHRWY